MVRDLVHILAHDLTREPPPRPPYDLIVCRNVVIYFERQAQERLFQAFVNALAPGGVLLLGKVETLFGPARQHLTLVDPRERIYIKPDERSHPPVPPLRNTERGSGGEAA